VVGLLAVVGRFVVGALLVGRFVVGALLVVGRFVVGALLVVGRFVVGALLVGRPVTQNTLSSGISPQTVALIHSYT
jgi:hypothetical protein